jgi:hypothetical protein
LSIITVLNTSLAISRLSRSWATRSRASPNCVVNHEHEASGTGLFALRHNLSYSPAYFSTGKMSRFHSRSLDNRHFDGRLFSGRGFRCLSHAQIMDFKGRRCKQDRRCRSMGSAMLLPTIFRSFVQRRGTRSAQNPGPAAAIKTVLSPVPARRQRYWRSQPLL